MKKGLAIVPVGTVDEVLEHSLTRRPVPIEWEPIGDRRDSGRRREVGGPTPSSPTRRRFYFAVRPAVEDEFGASHQRRVVGGEEDHRAGDLVGAADATADGPGNRLSHRKAPS